MTVQSTLFSKITKAAIALPVVAAGLAFNAGSAEAAGLTGRFQIGNFLTTANLGIDAGNQNTGVPDLVFTSLIPGDPEVLLTQQEGDFVGYNSAFINDLIPADTQNVVSFLDLSLNLPGTPGNTADGLLTFDVTSNDGLDITQQVQNLIAIDISLGGIFNTNAGSPNNETSYGQAIFTLQYAEDGITVDSFQTRLAAGEIFEGITFSGAAFTATGIPEPATVLGLLAVTGLAGTAIRKRKADV